MPREMVDTLTERPPVHVYPDDPRPLTEEFSGDRRYTKVDAEIGGCWMCQIGKCIQWQRHTKHENFIQHTFISP